MSKELTSAMYSSSKWRGSRYFEDKIRQLENAKECGNFTSGRADMGMSSASGSSSSPSRSGLGPAAPLSLGGSILSLRVARNPRIKMH